MKIIVLGATGHIGSHVVTEALAHGHQVVAYVRDPDAAQPRKGLRLDWTIVYPVKLKETSDAPAAVVRRLDQVGSVPGLATQSFVNVARALIEVVGDDTLCGQRVLVTTSGGWKPSTGA